MRRNVGNVRKLKLGLQYVVVSKNIIFIPNLAEMSTSSLVRTLETVRGDDVVFLVPGKFLAKASGTKQVARGFEG